MNLSNVSESLLIHNSANVRHRKITHRQFIGLTFVTSVVACRAASWLPLDSLLEHEPVRLLSVWSHECLCHFLANENYNIETDWCYSAAQRKAYKNTVHLYLLPIQVGQWCCCVGLLTIVKANSLKFIDVIKHVVIVPKKGWQTNTFLFSVHSFYH